MLHFKPIVPSVTSSKKQYNGYRASDNNTNTWARARGDVAVCKSSRLQASALRYCNVPNPALQEVKHQRQVP